MARLGVAVRPWPRHSLRPRRATAGRGTRRPPVGGWSSWWRSRFAVGKPRVRRPRALAANDLAQDGHGAAQHPRRRRRGLRARPPREWPSSRRPRAAIDDRPPARPRRRGPFDSQELRTHPPGPLPELAVEAEDEAPRAQLLDQDVLDEARRLHLAQLLVEVQGQRVLHPGALEVLQPVLQGRQRTRRPAEQHLLGVLGEGHDRRERVELPCPAQVGREDRPVPQVDAVEDPDADDRRGLPRERQVGDVERRTHGPWGQDVAAREAL